MQAADFYKDDKLKDMVNIPNFFKDFDSFNQLINIYAFLFTQLEQQQHTRKVKSISEFF